MPHGARTSLVILITALGIGGASAAPAAGSSWTDPPARKPAAETPVPAAPKAASTTPSTPAAAPRTIQPAAGGHKTVAARHVPERRAAHPAAPAAKRMAAAPHRARLAAAPYRISRSARFVAAAPPPPPQDRYLRDRPYGYGPGYGPGYADERLERLRAAEAAGYLVVRGRTVQYPDGRTLRVYRPDDAGEPF